MVQFRSLYGNAYESVFPTTRVDRFLTSGVIFLLSLEAYFSSFATCMAFIESIYYSTANGEIFILHCI